MSLSGLLKTSITGILIFSEALFFSACVTEPDILENDPWSIQLHGKAEYIDVPPLPLHGKLPENNSTHPKPQWISFRALVYGTGQVQKDSKNCDQHPNDKFLCKLVGTQWLDANGNYTWPMNLHKLDQDLVKNDSIEKIKITASLEGTEQNCKDYAQAELRYRCATYCAPDKPFFLCPHDECNEQSEFPDLFYSCKYHTNDVFILAETKIAFIEFERNSGNFLSDLLFLKIEFTLPNKPSIIKSPVIAPEEPKDSE